MRSAPAGFEHRAMVRANKPQRSAQPLVLDIAHLRRYTLGDRGLEREILDLFVEQLPKTIVALKTAAVDRDWRMAAHTLKGSARAVGAHRLAMAAVAAEAIADIQDRETCHGVIGRIEAAVAEIEAEVSRFSAQP